MPPFCLLLSGEISDKTLGTVRKRLHGFVYALLTVTRTTLETSDSDSEKGKIPKTMDDFESRHPAKRSWHVPSAAA
jgi:hypothetical protein